MSLLHLLSVSWPRPIQCEGRRWISDPEWDAPPMAMLPEWREREIDGASCQTIDWREVFGGRIRVFGDHVTGQMKEFHVVFRLRVEASGTLVFYDDDGCIVRRDGEVLHEDREAHALTRHELRVQVGDRLEIAQWQYHNEWLWAARLEAEKETLAGDVALFEPYRVRVEAALRDPNGPPLKTYTAAAHPVRTALSIYSLILNGYRPAAVQIFGDYQWDPRRRLAVEALLPFAEIVPMKEVERTLNTVDRRLLPLARSFWSAMKICVTLFHPPFEYCFLDDDIYILDPMTEALRRFRQFDFVYAPDWNHDESYRHIWSPERTEPFATGNVNTGLYLLRNRSDRKAQAERLLRVPLNGHPTWLWEQGFFAYELSGDGVAVDLPTQQYFYPIFDGMPGGLLGYDWRGNPCGFVSAHFGGLQDKPTDQDARRLVRDILDRNRSVTV